MDKREHFVQILEAEVGYIEGHNNATKYGVHTKANFLPWCGSFCNWAAFKAKYKAFNVVSTKAGANAYKKAGKWHDAETATPQRGWYAFMGFDKKNPQAIQHVGTVRKVLPLGFVLMVEGNTSPDKKGSQANGGEVAFKVRAYKKKNGSKLQPSKPVFIIGFGQNDLQGDKI